MGVDDNDPLIRDFLGWLATCPRPRAEVIDAWRSSCPRLTIFEDATDRGFAARREGAEGPEIILTAAGRAFLERRAS